ncbi:Lrp/AsnC family transcriptional regulator [Kineosporia succinea]|uniref:Lrp/AsnC family transcriptional regulator for asnA, asnC and gidA n=1 Tax=Kineosporia succinea TaxID=84632 RepID=A0ABT9P3X4_9ACTN|nr:Lrp/AsnC family transcriptional regulator [Kineosporia succinea]MDP9827396.1 Lrp/AsnC family transcriptional regulator for asnA, asnC and gidA [Kineosporia succinea]
MDIEAVDVIDRKIIDQLRIDGRRSFGEIGRYVGLSEGSVRTRYKRLLSLGIVQVVGMPNAPKMGYLEAHLSIRVRGATLASVATALSEMPEVKYVGSCIGSFDLIVDVRFESHQELSAFLSEKVRRVPGIETIETATTLEIMKDTYLWAGFRDPVSRPTRPHPTSGA